MEHAINPHDELERIDEPWSPGSPEHTEAVPSNHPSVRPDVHAGAQVERLVARVAELERAQVAEDVNGFLSLFHPDAVWVTGGGRRLIGLEAIAAFTREVLPGWTQGGASATYEVAHVLFIENEVALTSVVQTYRDAAGAVAGRGLPSYIWKIHGPDWLIMAGQNTAVEA